MTDRVDMQAEEAKALAIIPARGGSKGIPRKNIVDLGGHPLIAYSILAARQAPSIGTVLVSTDDEEIAEVARSYGAVVPFLRPRELSGDRATLPEVNQHAMSKLHELGYRFSISCVLLPTHPFRSPGLIETLVQKRLEGYSPVATVRKIDVCAGKPGILGDGGRIIPLVDYGSCSPRSVYRNYGLFYSMDQGSGNNFHLHVVENKIELIDIDTPNDLEIAREVVRCGLYSMDQLTNGES